MADEGVLGQLRQQIVQNERWLTVGRLIAAVCHELTNRMQAVQGALSLAAEEPALSMDMQTYLSICSQETRRVSEEIERLRSIYHPEGDRLGAIDLPKLLKETGALVSDSSISGAVRVEVAPATDIPAIRHRAGQLRFVLLGLLLNLIELIGPERGGKIWIQARRIGPTVQVEVSTDAALRTSWQGSQGNESEAQRSLLECALGLPTFWQVIQAENGDLGITWADPGLSVWFSLPIDSYAN